MRLIAVFGLILSLCICSCGVGSIEHPPGSHLRGEGKRDTAGLATGNWKLYGQKTTQVVGRGRFVAGKAEGLWTLYDSNGTKNGEVTYRSGVPHGDYRYYFTSFSGPAAAGKIKTIGHVENGVLTGRSRRFEPTGLVLDYQIENGHVTSVAVGNQWQAEQMMAADRQLMALYTREIHIGGK